MKTSRKHSKSPEKTVKQANEIFNELEAEETLLLLLEPEDGAFAD